MSSRKQIQAVFFSLIMVLSVVAMGAGGAAAQPSVSDEGPIEGGLQDVNTGQESTATEQASGDSGPSVTAEPQEVQIADGVRDRDGTAVLLLSVDRGIDRAAIRSGDVGAQALQADSEATLEPVAQQVNQLGAAEVRQQFWVSNTLSVEINLDRHSVEDLADIEGVTAITPNVEITHPAPPETDEELTASVEQTDNYTYGLEQIDVPGFEEKYGDRGGNATVTVIDDGVSDPDNIHPDLEFAQTAIASNGNITTGTLGSAGSHGEHVAGTISGAAEPAGDVPRYGVAPNANVIMINAFEGGATLEDILTGVEYSVEQDSDVTSMSLGFPSSTGFSTISNVVENTMQDSVAAGTLVTVSAGNSGAGDTGGPTTSPGAEFTSMAIGASNDQGNIASFSSGDVINPNQIELIDANGTYPDNFPRQYVKPDVSAPGAAVLSTGPLGTNVAEDPTYSTASGTSMAAPHVAGAATLLQSMTEDDLDPKLIEMALAETAEKPDNAFPSEFNRDIRYGTGIINVTAAADALMDGSMAVDGTVTDSDGNPIEGASVSADSGALTSTNASGAYTLHTTQDEVNMTVDAFGYEASTQTADADEPVDVTLDDALEFDLIDGQDAFAEFGGEVGATVDVRNLESLTVDVTEETNVSQDDLTLLVNGNEEAFGETVDLGQFDGTATVTVDIADSENLSEGQVVGLEHTFEGLGDSTTVETGPTTLTEELEPAFFELSNLNAPDEVTVGNAVPLTVDVTNTGQETATKDVQVVVAQGGAEGSLPPSSYELEPGETTTVQVNAAGVGGLFASGQEFEAGFRSADSIEQGFLGGYVVDGLNDEINSSIALQAQGSSFQVSSLDAPTEVDPGADVEVTATVQNIGAESDEQNVTFQFGGETVATESVALDAYELNSTADSAELTFNVTAPAEEGVYTHGVATEDDEATATLGVGVSVPSVTVVSTNEFGAQTATLLDEGLSLNGQAAQVSTVDASDVDADTMANTDVFVFHNLEGVAGDVIPMVEDDPTTSAVYLEQFADANAIAQRSDVIGDPASATADFEIGGPPVEFTVTQDHPLFDGVADAGESFEVHSSSDSDFVFFEGASGETLAESGLQGSAPAGPTAAVDPDSGSVLLGTIAPNTYESVDVFTDEAARVLANSVSVAQDGIVTDAVGSTSIDAEFIGTVDDAEDITVTANDVVSDGEVVESDTITFTVGGEPVTTATVENGTAEATFDPQTLDADAGETLTVSVEEYSVIDAAEVDTVDETADLEDGFNLLSVPQAADLATENVSTINTWNSSAGTYDSVTASTFDSASDLHNGLYVSAAADDARLGFTFSEDVPVGGTADINSGWNLIGSNFPIDSPEDGDERSLDADLIEVNPDELTVFDSSFNQQYDGNSTIGGYEAYWAFNDETESAERAIISPAYEVSDREGVLGIEDSDFEVTDVDATVVSDEVEARDNHEVLGSNEQFVRVDVDVTNNGGLDTQFVDLAVGDERVDRSLGVTLENGDSTNETLYYTLSQDDVPGLTVEGLTEDESATDSVELGVNGLFVEDQALTLDDEFVVSGVDYNGEATLEVVSNDSVVGSATVSDTATDLPIDVNASQIEDSEVEVRLLNADGEQETNDTATIDDTTIEVTNDAPAFALSDQDSVNVPVDVTNNALIEQTTEVSFSVGGAAVDNTTVDVGPSVNVGATSFTADVSGLSVGDSVEHTVSAEGSSDTRTLTIAESTVAFNNQSVNDDGEVLVEDVTASADQTVVITDTDLNQVGAVSLDENVNNEEILVDIGEAATGDYIAHIVASTDDVADEPGLVNDQATIVDADVTVDDVSKTFDEDETAEVSEVTVQTANVAAATETNFTVELRENGTEIGESDTLTGSNSVSVTLDEPITDDTTIDAVLIGDNGETIEEATEDGLEPVSDNATVDITVNQLDASVTLPNQELSSYNGSDTVLVEDVTGDAGQYVVITDSNLNIVGTHTLEEDVASEDIEVALDESVEPGEYRAHLTSDVQLVGDDGIVSDAGVLVNASVTFANQSYLDDTGTVTIDSASVDDGIGGETEYTVKLHEVTESGGVGDIVGSSDLLTGTQNDVSVSVDQPIEETGEYVAMLHFADGSPNGSSIGESPVTDRATVTIEPTEASYQLSDLEPADVTVDTGQTFSVSATVTNTGDLAGNQTIELRLDGNVVATETDVELAGGASTTVTFEGVSVSEVGEYTHTVASEDDSVSGDLTVVAEEVTFNDQSPTGDRVRLADTTGPDRQVLVEDVTTTSPNQTVVITDSEFNIVGQSDELGMVVEGDILIDLDEENPTGEYIAHVVADASDVGSNGPNLVTDQATLVDADVSVDNVTVTETEENLSVSVDEITVQTANVEDADTDGTNFTVELRQDGDVIGESDTLNGSNSDVQISLDTPIEATSTGTLTEDITAVLVDETGTAFQEPDVDQTAFQDVSDDATVEITVSPADASVSLPDQEIGAANGSDAVYTTNVTGDAGQYVVITDGDQNIIGSTELDERAAGDQVIVELDETIERGQYRAHLTTDVGLIGGDALITDTGEVYDAAVSFEDQEFVGATEEVTVATAELLDGGDNTTNFAVAIHETENGSVGDIIGNTTGLNGTESDVKVALDDGESISEDGDYVAMLHFENDTGGLGAPIQAVEDATTVAPVTDSATITSIEGALEFNDQSFNATDGNVVVEDVQANTSSTLVLTYTDADGNRTIAGVNSTGYENATPNDLEVPVDDASGFPGAHTAHLIPTDEVSDLGNYSAGDEVSDATLDNVTVSKSATVFDTTLTIEDQSVEDSTESVTVTTADLFDDVDNGSNVGDTTFGVAIHENGSASGDIIGFEGGLTANNSDVTVGLDREINSTEDVVAMLHVSNNGQIGAPITESDGSGLAPVTDGPATVTVQQAVGGNVDLREQAVGTNGEVVVENVTAVDVVTVDGDDPQTNAFDPQNDFLVLTDGSGVNDGDAEVIDSVQLSSVAAGADVTLNASGAGAGEYTVVLHEPTEDGSAPDPDAPRTNASSGEIVNASATVFTGDVVVNDQTLVEDQDALDTITLATAELDDGSADGATFTVVVENSSNDAELGNETVTGSTTTVQLDDALPRGDTDITVRLEQDGAPVEQAPDFDPITDSATVTTEQSQFDLTLNAVNGGMSDSAEVAEGTANVNVSVSVTNNGDFDDAQPITAEIIDNGTVVASDAFTNPDFQVQQGETRTLVLDELSTGDLAPGTYDVNVSSDDDQVSGELTVLAPNAELEELSIGGDGSDAELTLGQTTENIDVTVNNTGDIQYTGNVTLTVSNASGTQISEETSVGSVAADDTSVETFTDVVVGDLSQGEYDVTVASDDDTTTGTLSVLAVEVRNLDIDENGTSLTIDEGDGPVGINATLENFNSEFESRDVTLTIGDTDFDSFDAFQLGAGDTRTITFDEVAVQDLTAGDYDVSVATPQTNTTGSLQVDNLAVDINSEDSSLSVIDNETAVVNTTLTNEGDSSVTQTIELNVSGVSGVQDSQQEVTVGGGNSTTIDLSYQTNLSDDGETVTVTSDQDSAQDTLSVQSLQDALPADNGSLTLEATTYAENITISANNTTITGAGTDATTIDGNVTVEGDNNTIEDLTIEGNLTDNGQNNSVGNAVVTSNSPGGSIIIEGTDASISNTQAENVTVNGSATITDSTVSNNGAGSITVTDSGDATVSGSSADAVSNEGTATLSNTSAGTVSGAGTTNYGSNTVQVSGTDEVFNSVQNAVSAASADATVTVQDGTYDGKVILTTEGLTLEGPNAGTNGNDTAARSAEATLNGPVFVENDNITVNGFEINDLGATGDTLTPGPGAIQISTTRAGADTANGTTISNNVVTASTAIDGRTLGVSLEEGADNVTVDGNLITGDNADGVVTYQAQIDGLEVTDNTFQTAVGVISSGQTTATISGNNFVDQGTGIGIANYASLTIENNNFTDNGGVSAYVVDQTGGLDLNTIQTGNTFTSSTIDGNQIIP